jgi:HD superfamily phosphohydrolase
LGRKNALFAGSTLSGTDTLEGAHAESAIRDAEIGSIFALSQTLSGSLDLDKIDYLSRDARMCGVPYGEIMSIPWCE